MMLCPADTNEKIQVYRLEFFEKGSNLIPTASGWRLVSRLFRRYQKQKDGRWQGVLEWVKKGLEPYSNRKRLEVGFSPLVTLPKTKGWSMTILLFLAGAEGLEPTTHGFGDRYSTN